MADPMAIDDDAYASEDDSDFAPERAPDHASVDSDADDDDAPAAKAKLKAKTAETETEAEDAGFENSGDEAVIGKGKKRRRRDGADADAAADDGGAGGFVKTRSQRATEKAERKAAVARGPVTVDVDALWRQMVGEASAPASAQAQESSSAPEDLSSLAAAAVAVTGDAGAEKTAEKTAERIITIRRTYNFAGKVHTEEKRVARDSAEAKLYLAEHGPAADADDDADADADDDERHLRPPPRRAFRSAFEPVDAVLRAHGRTDLDLGLAARLQARANADTTHAKKLTTVEKSRMDWAGFVDREGIQDELALAGKSKGAFADRQDFLVRTEMRREDEARRARMASKV